MKHDKKRMDIIERGIKGNLENISEFKIYLNYLIKNRNKNIKKQIIKKFKEYVECILEFYIIGIISLNVFFYHAIEIPIIYLISFDIFSTLSFFIIPYITYSKKIKQKYDDEIGKITTLINDYEEKKLENTKEIDNNVKVDAFIKNIVDLIEKVLDYKYNGYKKDLLALKSLAYYYLKEKQEDDNYNIDELSLNPKYYKILVGVENNINNNIKIKQMQDVNIEALSNAFINEEDEINNEILSSEELLEYSLNKNNKPKLRIRN